MKEKKKKKALHDQNFLLLFVAICVVVIEGDYIVTYFVLLKLCVCVSFLPVKHTMIHVCVPNTFISVFYGATSAYVKFHNLTIEEKMDIEIQRFSFFW